MTDEAAIEKPKGGKGKRPKKGSDEQFDRLGTGNIGKIMVEFAIPATVGLAVNGLYNILSAIFLGWGMGELGLAVSTVANPMMMFFIALGMLVGVGGNSLAAIKLGEGRKDEAERVLGNTTTLGIIAYAVSIVLAVFFIDPILAISGATDVTWEPSRMFLQIISFGSIFQILGFGVNNFIRSAGDPNRALWSNVVGAVACTVFSYLFVIVFGWGIVGQAAATVLGQGVMFVVVFHYFIFSKNSPFKLYVRNLVFRARMPLTIVGLGSASFFMQLAACIVSFVVNNQVVAYGAMSAVGETGCFAVFAVIQRVAMFVMFPVMGITIGAQPLLGYNYGARIPTRVKKTLKLELQSAAIICIAIWLLVELAAGPICALFGIGDQLYEFCVGALRFQTIVMPVMCFQIVISSYYQATGKPVFSIVLSLTRQFIYLIPIYIFAPMFVVAFLPQVDPIYGVLAGPPVADILSFFTAIVFVIIEFRKLNRAIALEDQGVESGYGPKFGEGPRAKKPAPEADGAESEAGVVAAQVAETEAGASPAAATVDDGSAVPAQQNS